MIDLQRDYWKLIKLRDELPRMPVVEVIDDPERWHLNPTIKTALAAIGTTSSVLDVGAGDRRLERILLAAGWRGSYKSLDIEGSVSHDYSSIDDVVGTFDAIFMMEVMEHLQLDVGLRYLDFAAGHLREGGHLLVSTPNMDNINRLWKTDITHIQQYPARDLYALLRLSGFAGAIKGYRVLLSSRSRGLSAKQALRLALKRIICKILDADHTEGIFFVAEK
jgi:SAM-dependent methyltransferase